jgi:LysM repeat protein
MAIDDLDTQWALVGGINIVQVQPDAVVSSSRFPGSPSGMCIDDQGNIYFTEGQRVRVYDKFGTISTIAGEVSGYQDGLREPSNPGKGALPSTGNIHVVKAGETLTQIAKQSHTTIKAIQAVNGLKTTRVLVGQKLRLPAQSAA